MKILVVAAIIACARAAPSNVILPAGAATVDPGDLQAAAIDAQVQAEDQARALSESAQEFNEKIVEVNKEKIIESDSLVKEKTEEAFWQAIDAVKTAEAKLDGAVAGNADKIAKSAIGGLVIPAYINPQLLPAPIVRSPIVPAAPLYPAPIIPAPVLTAPVLSAPVIPAPIIYATPGLVKQEEKEKESVKTAELGMEKKAEENLQPQKEAEKPLLKDEQGKPLQENPEKPALPIVPLVGPAIKLPQVPQLPQLPQLAQWAPNTPLYLPQPVFLKANW